MPDILDIAFGGKKNKSILDVAFSPPTPDIQMPMPVNPAASTGAQVNALSNQIPFDKPLSEEDILWELQSKLEGDNKPFPYKGQVHPAYPEFAKQLQTPGEGERMPGSGRDVFKPNTGQGEGYIEPFARGEFATLLNMLVPPKPESEDKAAGLRALINDLQQFNEAQRTEQTVGQNIAESVGGFFPYTTPIGQAGFAKDVIQNPEQIVEMAKSVPDAYVTFGKAISGDKEALNTLKKYGFETTFSALLPIAVALGMKGKIPAIKNAAKSIREFKPNIKAISDIAFGESGLKPVEPKVGEPPPFPEKVKGGQVVKKFKQPELKETPETFSKPKAVKPKEPWEMTKGEQGQIVDDLYKYSEDTYGRRIIGGTSKLKERLRLESLKLNTLENKGYSTDKQLAKVKSIENQIKEIESKSNKTRQLEYKGLVEGAEKKYPELVKSGVIKINKNNEIPISFKNHRDIIKQALSEGKSVPAEVLKDYPELAKNVRRETLQPPTPKPEVKQPSKQEMPEKINLYKEQKPISELKIGEYILGSEGTKAFYPDKMVANLNSQKLYKVEKINDKSIVVSEYGKSKLIRVQKEDWRNYGQDAKVWYPNQKLISQKINQSKAIPAPPEKVPPVKPMEATGAKNMGGSGRTAAEIPKSLEPSSGKPVGPADIHRYFKKTLNLPIRMGHFAPSQSRFWAGFYRTKSEVVRMKDFKAIGTLTHEIAHHIDKKYDIRKLRLRSQELSKLDYSYPKKARTSEGFPEYIRIWMTGADDVAKLAPKFTKQFESFLKGEPELKAILDNGKKLITQWREQGAVKRVYSQIDMSGKPEKLSFGQKIGSGIRKARELFVDDLAQLDYAERQIRGVKNIETEARLGRLRPSESPTMVARADAKKANSKAKSMILDGTFDYSGKRTGISLRDALAPVSKDIENFLTYAYSKRAVDLYKRNINPGIELGDAQYTISKLESPKFNKALKEVTNYQDRVLEYLKEAGGLSDEAMGAIREMNPIYVPLKRVFEADKGSFLSGKKLSDVSIPIKRIKGSGRQVKNPLYSMIENTAQIIQTADKIRVGKSLIELAEKTEGVGKWVEKVPTPKQFNKIKLELIEKQLKESGVDLSEADLGQVVNFFSNSQKYLGKDNIVSFWRNGKKEFYEVDPALYRSLSAMDAIQLKGYMRILGMPARAVRLGATGLRAGFSLITNPIRDAFGFALQTEFSRGTPDLIGKGLYRKLSPNNQMHQLFKKSGTDFSQYLGIDRRQLKNAVDEVLASDTKRKALNVVKHPIEALKAALSVTEAGPRLAEFEAAYKKGEKLYGSESADARILASIAASDVTVNFGRMGTVISSINQLIPFFNAGIQGISKFNRYMLTHPVEGGLKAVATITTPTVVLWNMNKDEKWYKDMPDWQKYGFWNIHLGTNADKSPLILRIPRPFEWGIAFGGIPEATLNYWYDKDPEKLKDATKQMVDYVNPIDLPTVMKIPIEMWANYDFFRGRDIDPFFEVMYKNPEDRYGSYTTETSKFIGKTFGLSPRMIDHLIGSSTGGLGIDITKAIEGIGKPSTIKNPADYPVVGRLFGREYKKSTRASRRIKMLKKKLGIN